MKVTDIGLAFYTFMQILEKEKKLVYAYIFQRNVIRSGSKMTCHFSKETFNCTNYLHHLHSEQYLKTVN